jgi:hypothetical protein
MEKLCKFAVLRYVPNENRQEFINIGIVFHSPDDKFIDCKITTNFSRVSTFDDEINLGFLKLVLEGIEEDFTKSSIVHGPSFDQLAKWDFLERATSFYVNQLQFSPIRFIRSSNYDILRIYLKHMYNNLTEPKRLFSFCPIRKTPSIKESALGLING